MSRGVKVQIFGQSYTIMGDLDEAYVQQLAAYVDAKMQAITGMTSTVDTQKAAVLAALAIADELHSSRKEKSEREELLKEQAERCLTLGGTRAETNGMISRQCSAGRVCEPCGFLSGSSCRCRPPSESEPPRTVCR